MDKLEVMVSDYNELVEEWNRRYGDRCSAMPVNPENFRQGYTDRVKSIFADGMSERRKISITTTVIGDFKNVRHKRIDEDGLSKGELASLIVNKGEQILNYM